MPKYTPGHAGISTADYAAQYFQQTLQSTKQWGDYKASKNRSAHVHLIGIVYGV